MTHIVMRAAANGRYHVLLDGKLIQKLPFREPFYGGARRLIEMGHDPEDQLTASHAGSRTVAMASSIGEAAMWTVAERDRGGLRRELWQPRPDDIEQGHSDGA